MTPAEAPGSPKFSPGPAGRLLSYGNSSGLNEMAGESDLMLRVLHGGKGRSKQMPARRTLGFWDNSRSTKVKVSNSQLLVPSSHVSPDRVNTEHKS